MWTRLAEERNQTIGLTGILFNMIYFKLGFSKTLRDVNALWKGLKKEKRIIYFPAESSRIG